jgi:hypothetical protein
VTRFFALSGPCNTEVTVRGDEPSFADPREAWEWLKLARMAHEDRFPDWNVGEYTDTVGYLEYAAGEGLGACEFGNKNEDWPLDDDGTGAIIGATPGVGDHADEDGVDDPGIAYLVVAR